MDGTIGRRPPKASPDALGPGKEVTATSKPESTFEGSVTATIDTIAGRYKLKSILGRGGVGVVYRANDMALDEEIAIKVLQGQATKNAQDLERFKREMITARKITHANVIRIHDFGMSGEEAFISMELLLGGTLADVIEDGPLESKKGLEIAIGVCEGLEAAHQIGIIHRDIKPDNVLFDDAGRPKLVDFGLARLASAPTRTIGFSGTPFYVSPEQADGSEVTKRSDIYSLGVLLFEMFTGRLPFLADNLVRLAMMHANEPPPTPRSVRPELSPSIEAVILRCLQKDASARYASAVDVANDLRAIRDGKIPAEPGARDEATLIRSMPSMERTAPSAGAHVDKATLPPTPVPASVRQPTGDRVSARVRPPTGTAEKVDQTRIERPDRVSQRPTIPPPVFEAQTLPPPPRRSAGPILLVGSVAALVVGVVAVGVFGGTAPEPSPTPLAVALKTFTPPAVAIETIEVTSTPPLPPTSVQTPTKTPGATPTATGTKLALATPRRTEVPTVDLTEASAPGNVRFTQRKVNGKTKYPNVRCSALGLSCVDYKKAGQPMSLKPGRYEAVLFEADDTKCKKPIATGTFEVRSGGLTNVALDDTGAGILSTYRPR